eukprot:12569766-Alexandrium_andersonii.AAC.1
MGPAVPSANRSKAIAGPQIAASRRKHPGSPELLQNRWRACASESGRPARANPHAEIEANSATRARNKMRAAPN